MSKCINNSTYQTIFKKRQSNSDQVMKTVTHTCVATLLLPLNPIIHEFTKAVNSIHSLISCGHVTTKQHCEIHLNIKVHNDTVRRLFNQQIAIIYHGFTVIILTALWYCGRNVGYSYLILYIINVNMY